MSSSAITTTNSHFDYIIKLQINNELNINNYGGFELYIGQNTSTLKNTFYALDILKESYNSINEINKFACIEYITGRNLPDYGYAPEANMFVSYIDSTYFAISSLNILDSKSWINPNTSNWIKERQNLNSLEPENYGGFEWKLNFNTSYMEATYFGILSLINLKSLYLINSSAVIDWINGQKRSDGGYSPTSAIQVSSLEDTYYAVKTLVSLNQHDEIDINSTITFVKQLQNLNSSALNHYGGFKPFSGYINSTLSATYFAVTLLAELGQLEIINFTIVLSYIYSKQDGMGGFKDIGSQNTNLVDTYYAMKVLSIIEGWNTNNNGENGFINHTLAPILFIIGVIGLISIIKYYKNPSSTQNKKIKMKGGKKRFSRKRK
ncbi:MAG: prenyltransferase/squalene oxidase repeat-containing protein [Candidatus Helarchaeota archaeon]